MTCSRFYRMGTMKVLVAFGALLVAAHALGEEAAAINYRYSTASIVKSPSRNLDGINLSGRLWPQPKVILTPSNFAAFLGYENPTARTANKPALGLPWQQLQKPGPSSRWRPLAPAEGSERPPLNGVALRFWDEGAVRRFR